MQEIQISMQEGREVQGKSNMGLIPMNRYYSHLTLMRKISQANYLRMIF